MASTGIIVAQLGGPESLDEVEPFIKSIFLDPNLVPLPGGKRTRAVLAATIAKVRGRRSRANYAAIGGGSPIVATTQGQADALETELLRRGHDVVVAVAQRHGRPDTDQAVEQLLSAGVDRMVLLPLFPQYSTSTTGSSEAELHRVLAARNSGVDVFVVRSWCDHPSYLDAQARLVDEILTTLPHDPAQAMLIFSAHGLPQKVVTQGDVYPQEIEASVQGVMARVSTPVDYEIAFQSKAGPMKWIGPEVTNALKDAASAGRSWVGVVPISFVSEHVETIHELDIELKAVADQIGIHDFHRSRCFDVDPLTGPMLADVVEAHL